jgi:hypothetical protein
LPRRNVYEGGWLFFDEEIMKLKFYLFCSFCSFCLFCSLLYSTTWHIKQDGTGDFTSIQEGIDASTDSDTVLVYPGTYYENIIYNSKNITVASLELTTGNAAYIDSTIIDGQRQDSCVRVMDQETDANIQGLTLTNGQGHQYQYSAGNRGGGVLVYDHCTFNITNCIIKKNYASSGGGIHLGYYSIINISGTSILNNYVFFTGGGVVVDQSQLIFDADNRCNIYDNLGGTGLDIFSAYCEDVNVIVDTFSILDPTRYFANYLETYFYPNPYTFDILNYSLEQENQDLYVSPDGDDSNSGLSPGEPMKTINLALRKIVSDSLNPKTVHLASGTYSESANDQFFAIGGKSYINITGENEETTSIDGEFNNHPLLLIGHGTKYFILNNLTFQNNINSNYMLIVVISDNIFYENLIIQNHIGTDEGTVWFNNCGNVGIKNVRILNNTAIDGVTALYLPDCDSISVIDCVIKNNHASSSGGTHPYCGGMQASSTGDILIENCIFSGNTIDTNNDSNASALCLGGFASTSGKFTISNCLFDNNQCLGTTDKTVLLDCYDDIEIVNSTFIDNTSEYTLSLIRNHIDFHNNILRNNCNYEIVLSDHSPWGYISEIDISHCNIQGGQNAIYNQNNVNIINWLEGNIDEDPMFDSLGTYPFALLEDSPCIDTGTPDTTGLFLPPWDLLHNHRVWDGDGDGIAVIDMGCYEYGAEPYVEVTQYQIPNTQYQLTNYPNPFNPETKIVFNLPESGRVKVEIYNIKGQKVKTLLDCYMSPGRSEMIWNGKDDNGKQVSSGVYFYQLVTEKKIITKKMILIK